MIARQESKKSRGRAGRAAAPSGRRDLGVLRFLGGYRGLNGAGQSPGSLEG